MSENDDGKFYPLKSLHGFLAELDNEWDKFRKASLIGTLTSCLLLVLLGSRFLSLMRNIRRSGLIPVIDEFAFNVLVAVFVIYEIPLLLRQHGFFKKWERRIGLLIHLEDRLIDDRDK